MTNPLSEAPAAAQTPIVPDPEQRATNFSRFGSGLLLFAVVLCGILSASWTFILPRLTRIQLQGQTVELATVIPYEQRLRAQIELAESKRNAVVLPVNDEHFTFVKRKDLCYPLLQEVREAVTTAAASLGEQTVVLSRIAFDASTGTLELAGDVRKVGPRSMTVLAQFVQTMEELSFVDDLTPPAFLREEDKRIGLHSPFVFSLTLTADERCPAVP